MNRNPSVHRLNGAVYTPYSVAQALVIKALGTNGSQPSRILEPGAGNGVFIEVLKESGVNEQCITAVDVNHDAVANLSSKYPDAKIVVEDFLRYASEIRDVTFDLIIGNPPYIQPRNFSDSFAEEVRKLSHELPYPSLHLKNSWVAFVLTANKLLDDSGTMAFIVPYELMTVNYGQYLQSTIFSQFAHVDVFIPDRKVFDSIEQDAVAFVAKKSNCAASGIHLNRVRSLEKLSASSTHSIRHLTTRESAIDLKSFLLDSETVELLHKLRSQLKTIQEYCDSAPGIVTGANQFFILTREDVIRHRLKPWAHPILKKSSPLPPDIVFSKGAFEKLSGREPSYLIDFCHSNGSKLTSDARKYIEFGESQGFNQRFKCRNREPWYRVQNLSAPDGMIFKRCHLWPLLCINEAEVFTTDTAYQIRMKSDYSIQGLCYSFYNSLTTLFAEIDGRHYGGGVLELTPQEFKNLPIAYCEPSAQEFVAFVNDFSERKTIRDKPIRFGDGWLKHKLHLNDKDMKCIQKALLATRKYRLRHKTSDFEFTINDHQT